MEKVKELKVKANGKMRLAFKENKMILAISNANNMLEPDFSEPINSFSAISKYYHQLNYYLSIIEELKLNNKIWKKTS